MQLLLAAFLLVGVYARTHISSPFEGSKRCLELFLYEGECVRSISTNEILPYVSLEPFYIDEQIVDQVYRITKQYGTCLQSKHTYLEETCPKEITIVDTILRLIFETGSTYKQDAKRVLTCLNENLPVRMAVKDCVKRIWDSKITSTLWGDSCSMVEDLRNCVTLLHSCVPHDTVQLNLDKLITENKPEICTLVSRLSEYWKMNRKDIDYLYI